MQEIQELDTKPVFVKDNFVVDGTIVCKFIHSKFTEELKTKTGKDKLKFNLAENKINDQIINQLKNKEMYFLKRTIESNDLTEIKYPIDIKSFLNDEGNTKVLKTKKIGNDLFVQKKYLEKTETTTNISDNVSSISLKVELDIHNKNIKDNKTKTKLSIADLMELSKSEQLTLKVKIKCMAVFSNNCLYISGTLIHVSLDESKLSQIYLELKEKEQKDKKINLLPRDKLYISKYPTKASTIIDNVVKVLSNNVDAPSSYTE